jgi:hypothetical protein
MCREGKTRLALLSCLLFGLLTNKGKFTRDGGMFTGATKQSHEQPRTQGSGHCRARLHDPRPLIEAYPLMVGISATGSPHHLNFRVVGESGAPP